jgi:PPOX class probable F420-dependent enzyme
VAPATFSSPRPSTQRALHDADVLWLSSLRPDGWPHVLPIWFVWDGAVVLVLSKPHAQKVRNLSSNPNAMLAIGEPGLDFDVELVEGVAELLPTARVLPEAFRQKYADRMTSAGITPARFAAVYSQPIRITPTRWLDWGGFGWIDRPGHPAIRTPVVPAAAAVGA